MSVEKLKTTFPPQYNLYYPPSSKGSSVDFDLFIRILPEPASRLYSGVKVFELRKYVPRHTGLVFLFETGRTNAITGCFYFREYLIDTIEQLWERVGTKATQRERFDAYFATKKEGVALAVVGVARFPKPVTSAELRRRFPDFPAPPEPYVYLYTPVGGDFSEFLRSHIPGFVERFQL